MVYFESAPQDVAIPTTVKQLTTSSAENADNGVFGQEGAWRGHPGTEIGGSVQHRSSILRHRWPVPFWHDLPPPASNAYINARMEGDRAQYSMMKFNEHGVSSSLDSVHNIGACLDS